MNIMSMWRENPRSLVSGLNWGRLLVHFPRMHPWHGPNMSSASSSAFVVTIAQQASAVDQCLFARHMVEAEMQLACCCGIPSLAFAEATPAGENRCADGGSVITIYQSVGGSA